MIGLSHYLIVSAIIFSIGLVGVLRRRNLLMLFFATEVMLNGVNIAFASISHFYNDLTGQMFAFFIIAIAASEVAVGLGILIVLFKKHGSLDLDDLANMRG